ncbi:MAG: carboxypeptidase regulatory-like domain-containing protein [Candidatus Eremiobacteraeota bacterium]|nr:carboxypeptidase regulatory-like domain-containing protein [Candidatus Eremiobacteraeota bacterium]
MLRTVHALLALVAFVATSTGAAWSAGGVTGTMRGTLVDSASNAPVAGATVEARAESGIRRTTTDARGFFTFLDIAPDTYTVHITAKGYEDEAIAGITVFGDETQNVGTIKLTKGLKTIASVKTRNTNSAFQPNQTIDVTTFQGQRIDQALGEKGSTNFNQLVLSAPGVIQNTNYVPGPGNSSNAFTIRGSASVEIGYQFDGIDYRGSFFDENPSQGYLNGVGGGAGSMQVVSGAGDATQGGIGAGVVNIVPGRGVYPGNGFISFDVGGPWYDHSMAGQYGIATENGKVSDFFSFRSTRSAPQWAPYGVDVSDISQYYGTSFNYDDDVLNNFYYRFGKNNNQQIQVLTDYIDHRAWANAGGLQYANFYPYDQYSQAYFTTDGAGNAMWPARGADTSGEGWYQSVIPYEQHVPTCSTQPCQNVPAPTSPEQYVIGPTNLLKIGYTRSLGNETSLNTFFYNWGGLVANNVTGSTSDLTLGSYLPGYNYAGGRKVGFQAQATTIASDKHTLTLVGKFENGFPYWYQQNYGNTWQGFLGGRGVDQAASSPCSLTGSTPVTSNCYAPVGPRVEDWYLPANTNAPLTPVGGGNPCIGPALDNGYAQSGQTNEGCYLYNYMFSHGMWKGVLPTIPSTGFDYMGSDFQQFGIGLRDQWVPNSRLTVDYGVRMDGQNLKWAGNTALNKDLNNTADIGTGYAQLSDSYLYPRVIQPRIAVNYLLTQHDSVRFSYGRSASFFFGQTAGTPTNISGVDPILWDIPAKDNPGNSYYTPYANLSGAGPTCGSGWHPPGQSVNGNYVPNPNVYWSGAGTVGTVGNYFQCSNYAQSVYWAFDQAYAAPDIGGQTVATYNNYDLAYSHLFKNGWGAKLTGYIRRGYDTYQTVLLNAGPPDPVTGQQTAGSFQERQVGTTKTYGVEFMLTTPDAPIGWSGFLTMNYVNALTTTPPVSNSDSIPAVAQYLYETGALFHASYLPPLSAVAGIQYTTKNQITINPIFTANGGIPFGVGTTSYGFINGQLFQIPTGNIGAGLPYAGPGQPLQSYNSECYYDPAFPGKYQNPKYFACRGDAESVLAGETLTRPRLYMDLNLQYTHHFVTYGVYITNIFDNYRGQPGVNQAWQPVATGVGGAQTGQFAGAYPYILQNGQLVPNPLYQAGGRNEPAFNQFWLPFPELYVPGRSIRAYLQFQLGKP